MTWLVAGLILFLGVHSFSMLRGARDAVVAGLGSEMAFKALYSLLSLVGFILIIVGFADYRAAGMIPLWNPPSWGRHIAMLLLLLAFVSLAATYIPSHIRSGLKHPMILAVILWAMSHLLANGDLGSVLMFGGFLAWGVIARISMGGRARVIFAAAPQSPPLGMRNDIVIIIAGVALYAVTLIWLHPNFIGVPVIAM
jgi:uncharacterized membrane protein